jgi:hypothetical protein
VINGRANLLSQPADRHLWSGPVHGAYLAAECCEPVQGVGGGVEGRAAVVNPAVVIEQLADELVLADFGWGPPVPEDVLHGLEDVGGGILEDDGTIRGTPPARSAGSVLSMDK